VRVASCLLTRGERGLGREDEVGGDTDEGERLGEGDTDPHQDLQAAGQLGLTSNTLDGLADDDSNADGGADGCETVTDRRDVSVVASTCVSFRDEKSRRLPAR
jgi:hypothetical protein